MKKYLLLTLVCFFLVGAGCINQAIDSPSTAPNDSAGEVGGPITYSSDFFELVHPPVWSSSESQNGVATITSFTDASGVDVLTVTVLPDQAGITTSDRVDHLIQTSSWARTGSLLIAGNTATEVSLSESGAGPRYIFVTDDPGNMSYIFDIQTVGLEQALIDQILGDMILTF